MDIRQFRIALRARNFDNTCRFYGETLALPEVDTWEGDGVRGKLFETGFGRIEVLGRAGSSPAGPRDEAFDYQGPENKMVLAFVVPSAERAYEELHFREKNIPGGLRHDVDGALIFETHDPDGVKIVYRQPSA